LWQAIFYQGVFFLQAITVILSICVMIRRKPVRIELEAVDIDEYVTVSKGVEKGQQTMTPSPDQRIGIPSAPPPVVRAPFPQ
jgi:hypothetical protein